MRAISVALTLAFLHTIAAQRTPTISYITQDQIKDIGETVELRCSVQYASGYPVLWIKINKESGQDQIILANSSTIIIEDSRFSIQYNSKTSTYNLQIIDIQEIDAGYYQCKLQTSLSNSLSTEVELQVRRPPIIIDNSTQSVITSEGESIQLECYANGYPAPSISWRREDDEILPTGSSVHRGNILYLSAVNKESRGTYYCIAENGVGRSSKRNINVQVQFAPIITTWKSRVTQALHYDADLSCLVEAYPPPAISWYKDDQKLLNNQHYSLSQFTSADDYTDTTVRVFTIEKWQYGEYTCRAQNKLGSAEETVKLSEEFIFGLFCSPACKKAYRRRAYGTGVISVSSGPLIALVLLIVMILTNYYLKY